MPSSYQFGPYRLSSAPRSLYRQENLVALPPKVIDVLWLLVEKRGEVVSKDRFFSTVWRDSIVEESNLTQSVFVLRKTLAEIDGEQTYIETVPKRGYRFVAAVTEIPEPSPAPAPPPHRRHVLWLTGGAAVAATALVGTWIASRPSTPERQPVAIAVLPFENLSGDASQAYLVDGLTVGLINELGKVSNFRVRSRISALRHKGSRKPPRELAKDLGASALVKGSVTRSGDRVRVKCQLVDAAEGSMFWSQSYERRVQDLPLLFSEIAGNVADQVNVGVSQDEQRRLRKPGSIDADAFEAYLRGGYLLEQNTTESLNLAVAQFKTALRLDGRYAPAFCGLAEAYNLLSSVDVGIFHPREARAMAIGFARQALAIDPEMADAHAALARSCVYEWEWDEADKAIRQALALNPSCVRARSTSSTLSAGTGRFAEALRDAKLGCELDPLSISTKLHLIHVTRLARRFEEAREKIDRLLEVEPNHPGVLMMAGWINLDCGRAHQAIPHFEKAVQLTNRQPNRLGFLAQAYAAAGRKTEAAGILQGLLDYEKKHYLTPCLLALVNLSLENRGEFFRWFDRSFEERSNGMLCTRVEIFYDGVRQEPRFREIEALIFRRSGTSA